MRVKLKYFACRIATGLIVLAAIYTARLSCSLFLDSTEPLITHFAVAGLIYSIFLLPVWLLLPSIYPRFRIEQPVQVMLAFSIFLLPVIVRISITGLISGNSGIQWLLCASFLLPAALMEEIMFRGFIQDFFTSRRFPLAGILISSVIFANGHGGNPNASLIGIVNIFLFGINFGFLRILSGGIVLPTVCHWLWNSITAVILGVPVSGIKLPSLFIPPMLMGEKFGPEEWPFLTPLLLLSIGFLAFSTRDSWKRREYRNMFSFLYLFRNKP